MLASAAAVIVRFRRATGVERLQLKWLLTTVAFIAVMYAASMAVAVLDGARSGGGEADWMLVLQSVTLTSFGLIPISIGIAITRHGLYGIDALISRALLVGALGVFITAVYVGIVVGIGGRSVNVSRPCGSQCSRPASWQWLSSRCANVCSAR